MHARENDPSELRSRLYENLEKLLDTELQRHRIETSTLLTCQLNAVGQEISSTERIVARAARETQLHSTVRPPSTRRKLATVRPQGRKNIATQQLTIAATHADIDAALQQHLHHLGVTVHGGELKRLHAAAARATNSALHVGSSSNQLGHDIGMACTSGIVQRTIAVIVTALHGRMIRQQVLDDVDVPAAGSEMEWPHTTTTDALNVSMPLQQRRDDITPSLARSESQRTISTCVSGLNVSALRQ